MALHDTVTFLSSNPGRTLFRMKRPEVWASLFSRRTRGFAKKKTKWAVTCDFQQCGILTSVGSDEPMQPPLKLSNSKWRLVSRLFKRLAKGSDQTARMRRLVWAFDGRTYHIVGNLINTERWLQPIGAKLQPTNQPTDHVATQIQQQLRYEYFCRHTPRPPSQIRYGLPWKPCIFT